MVRLDTLSETQIKRDWIKSLALVAVCMSLVVVSLHGMRIDPVSFYERRFHSASFLMFPVFSALSAFTLFRLFVPWGSPVRMSSAGFVDLRAGPRVIPWDEISNVVRQGEFVTLTLRPKFAKSYPLSLTQRALKAVRKSAGPTHLLVASWCLETDPVKLLEIISVYRAKTP